MAVTDKAKRTQHALKKGQNVRSSKVRTNVHFFRPKTQTLPKAPRYERCMRLDTNAGFAMNVLRYPVKTDANTTLIEKNNTIVFIVDRKANKPTIKKAFNRVFNATVERVNTLITPLGEKKAFIKMSPETNALDVAARIGLA